MLLSKGSQYSQVVTWPSVFLKVADLSKDVNGKSCLQLEVLMQPTVPSAGFLPNFCR